MEAYHYMHFTVTVLGIVVTVVSLITCLGGVLWKLLNK